MISCLKKIIGNDQVEGIASSPAVSEVSLEFGLGGGGGGGGLSTVHHDFDRRSLGPSRRRKWGGGG